MSVHVRTIRPAAVSCLLGGLFLARIGAVAVDGTWSSAVSGNWTDTVNWTGGTLADGSGSTADFNTIDPAADVSITLNGDRTIGYLLFGDIDTATAAGWTLAGNTLTLAGGTPTLTVNALGTGKVATINSTLAGTAGFTKSGVGQLTVSNGGNNGLNGALVVNQGVLVLNTTVNYVNAIAQSAPVTVNAGAELRLTGGVNNFVRNPQSDPLHGAVELIGGTFDYQSSTHGHMGHITLRNGAVWKATAGGGYNGENMQLNGIVTVANTGGNTTASTIGPFSQGLALYGDREFNVADVTGSAAADLVVSAELEDNDGAPGDGVVKTGAGTMSLTTGASYTGATTVNGGRLLVSSTLLGTSGISVNNGATVELGATNMFIGNHGTAVNNARVLTVNGSTLLMNASMDSRIGNVTLNNGSTWTSNRGLGAYDVLLSNTSTGPATVSVTGSGASAMNGSGGIHLQGVQNFSVADVTGDPAADLTVSLVLAGPGLSAGADGGVNKTGAGTLTLTGINTYAGGTTVNAGVLHLNGGTGGNAVVRGAVTVMAGAELRVSGGDGSGLGYASGPVAGQRVQTLNVEGGQVSALGSGHMYYATVNFTGGGMSVATGAAYQLGNVTINSLASAAPAVMAGDYVIRTDTWNSLTPTLAFNVADGAAATDLLVSGALLLHGGSGINSNVTKDGAGTLVFAGNNTYAGTTAVNAGTLLVNGLHSGGGQINVSAAATLGGSGTVGDVVVADGGILAPGNSAGHLTVNNLSLGAASVLNFELGAPSLVQNAGSDFVTVGNTLILGGTLNLSALSGFGTPVAGNTWLIMSSAGGIADSGVTIGSAPALGSGLSFSIDASNGSQVFVTVVPEPAAAALLALGAAIVLRRRIRRS